MKKIEEEEFYQKIDLKNKKVCSSLMHYSSTRGFSEDQLYLELKTYYEDEHRDELFTWADWKKLKKESAYFRSVLEECKLLRKIFYMKVGLRDMVSKDKVNPSLYMAFMRNEFGWDKEKSEEKDFNFSEIKVRIVDDKEST